MVPCRRVVAMAVMAAGMLVVATACVADVDVGGASSTVNGVSPSGWLVGNVSLTTGADLTMYLRSPDGVVTNVPTFRQVGEAVNDQGVVAGTGIDHGVPSGAFRWSAGKGMETLVHTTQFAGAASINQAGIAGGGDGGPVLWRVDGAEQRLNTLPGAASGGVSALNDQGLAVGSMFVSGIVAAWWNITTGEAHVFPVDAAATSSSAVAVNQGGVAVGRLVHSDGTIDAVVWTDGTNPPTVLAKNGAAQAEVAAINDDGTIVGWTRATSDAPAHGARWSGPTHTYADLGTRSDQSTAAHGVDASGAIYGTASGGGVADHAVRLS
jgi:hypothetical protein